MSTVCRQTDLLVYSGRLLLEYNESTGAIYRTLAATARALTDAPCAVRVTYRGVSVALGDDAPVLLRVHELRYNNAVLARVHAVLDQVRQGELDAMTALAQLQRVEAETPHYPRWMAAVYLGLAAAALAVLLGADAGAVAVAAVSTSLGLFARKALAARDFSLLALPLSAAVIGGALGGLAIRLGWTHSPELALVVPALMLVPGPHLINGLLDLLDNYVQMSLARFGLALGILLASALGLVIGVELTLATPLFRAPVAQPGRLTVTADVLLAAIVTCGFAVFYNTARRHVWMAALGGMAGHGIRFLALQAGLYMDVATFLGGATVGVVSAGLARTQNLPVAVIGFAGAVTMIPGLSLYRGLAGALQTARLAGAADPETVAATTGHALHGLVVAAALALGLIIAARLTLRLAGERPRPADSHADTDLDQSEDEARGTHQVGGRVTGQSHGRSARAPQL